MIFRRTEEGLGDDFQENWRRSGRSGKFCK